ncbi:MAG: 2,3-bisphosphoglycerate-independent phosphoglycerate mutase [Chitinophagaceae bacterium]|jgi:2,3-bisphosphoglycerate-independent phosphoglycerate mutase|nr:2,3-bisphosphoglycerate-independent phosphoglycerate mutase [Chitinophagaceae bacterium]MBP6046483.1 2,3-bisphosphoglycerate-independent phosphoglycerate mutase [Ferruginibacter sp.]MBK7089237.1 2,3-bisphosphoglycerate-independent phosphoglycerate mutase [Chitinophagaceae bacterium]MBK7347592.1 2,3-bisphosphoglycerate-independent phosphoglycerate mutase [Chitinophagaceae bacterium]MBL0253850.1 2,3-bisphosphoglycerate-independent phosphoglycerate mutase [Chitinophagaceae bacterium]
MNDKKIILIIMDGWGLGKIKKSDAIQHAKVPFVDSLYNQYPNNTLVACGQAVGLPDGQMGNSEVGHLNLGAGRIVYQELERVNQAIKTGELQNNPQILAAINYAQQNNRKLHLLGLLSDGGVHSHIHHLKAIVSVCAQKKLQNVFVHAFTDGRDTDPKSGMGFIGDLQNHLNKTTGKIASVTGRYFAMDRDKRWERIKIAYEALVNGTGAASNNILESILASYQSNVTDEFIMPIINTACNGKIEAHDAVICFNFRTDRCREITQVLTQKDMPEYQMKTLPLQYTTMTVYDHTFKNVNTVFQNDDLKQTLGEVLSAAGKTQLRIAETEKYPHVSFFFSGGREVPFEGEKRIMIPSPKVATYDLQPQMSAPEVTEAVLKEINNNPPDFICLNFANADMVGHTGVWPAIIKAVETVDHCVAQVVKAALEKDYCIFLTADHGNADFAINEDGSPNTAHTLNLVPLFVIDKNWKGNVQPGKLGDIAPSILTMMDIPVPAAMTGNVLVK